MRLLFVEAPSFTHHRQNYLDDDESARLQISLLAAPDAGVMIPGTGGFRKLRWHDSRRNKGKRGGLRVVYYWMPSVKQLWLFAIYAKGDAEELTIAERRALKNAIDIELKAMLGKS